MGKHAEWRKLAKKLRRKRIRTALAVSRDLELQKEQRKRESSPTYVSWLEEQRVLEEFKEAEEQRLAMQRQAQWKAEEEAAMLRWREQQSRIAQAKAEKIKKEMLMREEWEREQRKLEEAEESRKKVEDEKKRKQAELLARIDAFIEGKADFPAEANVSTQTHPGLPDCPFFSKTGACRFRDCCSRNHTKPGISNTLLIPNFYNHFGLQSLNQEEYDTDLGLEYEDSETYKHFKEFYKDVLPEFQRCGNVTQFRVCTNEEPHLRGNVYVQFQSRRHALKAFRTFQGRFYAGRMLSVEFTNIPSWRNAICGLYHKQKCPKGKTCNFLHVFMNPNNAYKINNSSSRRQFSRSRSRSPVHRSRNKDWNWSDGSNSDDDQNRSSHNRKKLVSKKYDSGSDNDRNSSPRSSRHEDKARKRRRERKRKSRSRSPEKKGEHHKERSHYDSDRRHRKDKQERRSGKSTNGNDESSEKVKETERKSSSSKERSKKRSEQEEIEKQGEKHKSTKSYREESASAKHSSSDKGQSEEKRHKSSENGF